MSTSGQVRVVCTDRGSHPSRELAQLSLVDEEEPELLARLLEAHDPERAQQLYDWEMLWGRVQYTSTTLRRRDHGQWPGQPAAKLTDVRASWEGSALPRWSFPCRTCGRDVQFQHRTVIRLVEGLLEAGHADTASVDLSLLPANFA